MKVKDYKSIIELAIKDSKLNGYKWKITDSGLWWSYSESEFVFELREGEEEDLLIVKDELQGENVVMYFIGKEFYCDFNDIERAIYAAVKSTIRYCNGTY
jgi:hypothetical protein